MADVPALKKRILIHAASMGEYEQARPVLRLLKERHPDVLRVLSVFSPSVFNGITDSYDADILTYLPFDSPAGTSRFLNLISPSVLLIARHDIWPNLLNKAQQNGTKCILFDASVHRGSLRHKPVVAGFMRSIFANFHAILAISEKAADEMQNLVPASVTCSTPGDTRFDQVLFRAGEANIAQIIPERFRAKPNIIVAGSTWPEDEIILIPAFAALKKRVNSTLIVVPHELTVEHMESCRRLCDRHKLKMVVVETAEKEYPDGDVIYVNRMGVLAAIYKAGTVAFVGGGNGPGVHSVIEPAAHGRPVTFGPRMTNSAEALEMVDEKCGFIAGNKDLLANLWQHWFLDPEGLKTVSRRALEFVQRKSGASEKIAGVVSKLLANN